MDVPIQIEKVVCGCYHQLDIQLNRTQHCAQLNTVNFNLNDNSTSLTVRVAQFNSMLCFYVHWSEKDCGKGSVKLTPAQLFKQTAAQNSFTGVETRSHTHCDRRRTSVPAAAEKTAHQLETLTPIHLFIVCVCLFLYLGSRRVCER